jgi:hypothetical protein
MWFLARMLFWLSLVIALLPVTPSRQETAASQVGAADALSAVTAAVSDIRQFCVVNLVRAPPAHKQCFNLDKKQRPARNCFIIF